VFKLSRADHPLALESLAQRDALAAAGTK